jgi:hypothetical protein
MMAEIVFRLTGVKRVMVAEQVYSWVVRGEGSTGYANELVDFSKKRDGAEERACALATQWCQQLALQAYTTQHFTGERYLFLLKTVNVATGEIMEQHTENYGTEHPSSEKKG